MTFKPLTYCLLLGSVALSFSSMAKDHKPNIPVVTDEAELRNITDTWRGHPSRKDDFIPQGDGTVIDKRTGLQWMRCALGQKWTGETCEGKPYRYTWKQATKERSNFADHSDWRLPTMWELETLVYCSSGEFKPRYEYKFLSSCKGDYQKPAIVISAFPAMPKYPWYWYWYWYWSSSPYPYDDDKNIVWVVSFDSGFGAFYPKDVYTYVRLVRSGQ